MFLLLLFLFALLIITVWRTYPDIGRVVLSLREFWLCRRHGFTELTYHINGVPLSCEDNYNREKPLLILIHGMSADKSVWYPLLKSLNNDFRVVVPDLLGHGESRYSPSFRYDVQSQAQIINALIWQIGTTRAHVIGSSMGGHIAAYLASTYPETIKSCTLISPAGLPASKQSEFERLLARDINPFLITGSRTYRKLLNLTMARPPVIPFMVKDALCQQHMEKNEHYRHIFHDYLQSGWLSMVQLESICCPTLVVWGAKDTVIDVSALDNWQRSLKTLKSSQIYPELGHLPMVESPKRVYYSFMHFYQHHCVSKPVAQETVENRKNAG